MIRCKCGGTTVVENIANKGDSRVQDALNVQTRTRRCVTCVGQVHTTEVASAELHELRRRAYLWERYVDSEKAA